MFPYKIRMDLLTLLFVFLLSLVYAQERTIYPELNPGCKVCTESDTLVYIKANSSHDVLHQVWDFTRDMPTIIYAITKTSTTMNISWDGRKPTITLSEDPLYCFGMAIDELYEYSDCEEKAHISERCPRRALPLRRVRWSRQDDSLSTTEVALRLQGVYWDTRRTGIIDVKLDLVPLTDYASDLPHLIHSVNSTQLDVSLVNFTRSLNASRLAARLALTSLDPPTDTMRYRMRKSLDDEHTPGVFEIIEILTPVERAATAGVAGGFLQLRPVAYTAPQRTVSSSTTAYVSHFNKTSLGRDSTLGRFYARLGGSVLAQNVFVSFGVPGDGYYAQHNYTSWSLSYGYGCPPEERVSALVLALVGAGLGAPLLLALSAVAYVLVTRYRRRNAPQPLIDDE